MSEPSTGGTLYVVATPIGNLGDITLRALEILKQVDLVAAEDTRHSRKLFNHYGITTRMTACHEHNEAHKGEYLLQLLQSGSDIALISDAGTPAISDPGEMLVRRCREAGIRVVAVPGASACISALSVAGLPTRRFSFDGFLPPKQGARRRQLQEYAACPVTTVLYEAPHRLVHTLADIVEVLGGQRQLAVARELTKVHEELFRGSAAMALEHFGATTVRGEIVLLLAPAPAAQPQVDMTEALRELCATGEMSTKDIARKVAADYAISVSAAYQACLRVRGEKQ